MPQSHDVADKDDPVSDGLVSIHAFHSHACSEGDEVIISVQVAMGDVRNRVYFDVWLQAHSLRQ